MKTLRYLFLILTAAICTAIVPAQEMGTWNLYSSFCAPTLKTIVTPRLVYYISGGNLFSYNPDNQESFQYSTHNLLSDHNIVNAYYNPDGKYLLIFYDTGNIDLLYDDGKVRNFSDIAASEIDKPISLNDVHFDGSDMYLATNFGLVQYDVDRGEVKQSGIFRMPVYGITALGNHLVMKVDGAIRSIEKGKRFASVDALTFHFNYSDNPIELIGLNDTQYLLYSANGFYVVMRHTINFETGQCATYDPRAPIFKHTKSPYMIHGAAGALYYWADGVLYTLDENVMEKKVADLPDDFQSMKLGLWSGIDKLWSLSRDGIACHGLDGEGGVTTISERYRPNELTVRKICYFFPSVDGRYLYMQNQGATVYKFGNTGRGLNVVQNAARITLADGSLADFTCYPVEAKVPTITNIQKNIGQYIISPTSLAPDPDDPDVAFISTADDGIYKVRGSEFLGRFDETNSLLNLYDNRLIVYCVSIDPHGNLWAAVFNEDWQRSCMMVLPSDKRRLDPAQVKREDWVDIDLPSINYWGGQDVRILHCKKSNLTAVINHVGEEVILLYDNNGTPYDFTDDRFRSFEEAIVDQDGKIYTPQFTPCVAEDLEGRIWLGTGEGIFEIVNPRNAINSDENRVTHLKVPRNDGTNAADYLLGSEMIMDIAVDVANRKWIATQSSGLFLVSPTGNEILANFNVDNSLLPTNEINAVYADPSGSTIYVGTPLGLLTYHSDATPARSDFSDILVYPNPVRPDYTGDVYISGLMENTLVKIADASGAVVHQGQSEGGLYVWDARTSSGTRVKSGVYYVMVSSRSGDDSSAKVTKLMIIN